MEFQARGYPHSHNLIWTLEPGISSDAVGSSDPTKLKALFDLVNVTATSQLISRGEDDLSDLRNVALTEGTTALYIEKEKEYEYNIDKSVYFKDDSHPSRERINIDELDFTYRDGNTDPVMQA